MTEAQQFFIDILKLVPIEESLIMIQSPHEEILTVLKRMNLNKENIFSQFIKLNKINREILTVEIIYNNVEEFIHSLEIWIGNKKVFEGYDGMDYGMFSKEFNLPEEFKEKYIALDMCMISKDW